jgi:hypothetical protein
MFTTVPSILRHGLDKETILRAYFNNSNNKIYFFKRMHVVWHQCSKLYGVICQMIIILIFMAVRL